MKILNEPTHVCALPDPRDFAAWTDVMCEEVIVGGLYADGRCGRQFTRRSRWGKPIWANYDHGW